LRTSYPRPNRRFSPGKHVRTVEKCGVTKHFSPSKRMAPGCPGALPMYKHCLPCIATLDLGSHSLP
jgi:hypothetical protein